MPNAPKTPIRSFRCPDERWLAAKAASQTLGTTLTAELNNALDLLIKRAEKRG